MLADYVNPPELIAGRRETPCAGGSIVRVPGGPLPFRAFNDLGVKVGEYPSEAAAMYALALANTSPPDGAPPPKQNRCEHCRSSRHSSDVCPVERSAEASRERARRLREQRTFIGGPTSGPVRREDNAEEDYRASVPATGDADSLHEPEVPDEDGGDRGDQQGTHASGCALEHGPDDSGCDHELSQPVRGDPVDPTLDTYLAAVRHIDGGTGRGASVHDVKRAVWGARTGMNDTRLALSELVAQGRIVTVGKRGVRYRERTEPAAEQAITKNRAGDFAGLWDEAEACSKSVEEWPTWKRGEVPVVGPVAMEGSPPNATEHTKRITGVGTTDPWTVTLAHPKECMAKGDCHDMPTCPCELYMPAVGTSILEAVLGPEPTDEEPEFTEAEIREHLPDGGAEFDEADRDRIGRAMSVAVMGSELTDVTSTARSHPRTWRVRRFRYEMYGERRVTWSDGCSKPYPDLTEAREEYDRQCREHPERSVVLEVRDPQKHLYEPIETREQGSAPESKPADDLDWDSPFEALDEAKEMVKSASKLVPRLRQAVSEFNEWATEARALLTKLERLIATTERHP